MKKLNRREFVTKSAQAAVLAPVAVGMLSSGRAHADSQGAQPMQADEKRPLLSPTEPLAKTMAYHEDSNKVDVAKFPKRKDPKEQFCSNCVQYAAKKRQAKQAVPKTGQDHCVIFEQLKKDVVAGGWCNVWVKAP